MRIEKGLPDQFRAQAAEIYWMAFRDKLVNVLGPDEKGQAYFMRAFRAQHAICAIDGDQLLGVVGIDFGEGGIISDSFSHLYEIYGLSALWRIVLLSVFSRRRDAASLQMDGIAVNEAARGKGIGTALLYAVFDEARARELRYVNLEVIDRNNQARALYERLGFKVIKKEKLGIFASFYHFRYCLKMAKDLQEDAHS